MELILVAPSETYDLEMGNWLIHQELEREARWNQDHPALVFEGTTYSYAEFDRRVNQVAHALFDHGVGVGDDVVMYGLNHVDLFVLFFACSKVGAVYSTVSRFHSTRDVNYIIQEVTDPHYVFYTADDEIQAGELDTIRAALPDAQFVCLDDTPTTGDEAIDEFIAGYPQSIPVWANDHSPALIQTTNLTSGTTGQPKVALWDHTSIIHFSESLATVFPFDDADRWLTTSDMMVGRGPYARDGIRTLMNGGTIYLLREFDPEAVVAAIQKWDINGMELGFTPAALLIEHVQANEIDLSIDHLLAVVPSAKIARGLYSFSDNLYQFYATTEIGAPIGKQLHPPFDSQPALGRPLRGSDIKILPVEESDPVEPIEPGRTGELLARGEGVMTRYLDAAVQAENVQEGWIHSGDAVQVTEDHELVFVDRVDNRLRSGGLNVYPAELEAVLEEHDFVAQAVVVGVPDPTWGDRICALIVPTTSTDSSGLSEELDTFCQNHSDMAAQIRPREYAFVASTTDIPTAALGKIDRGAIKSRYFEE